MVSFVVGLAFLAAVSAKTTFTCDSLFGIPIISHLDVTDGPANQISRYWFSPASGQTGLPYFIPIFVARGTPSSIGVGPKLSLSGSIHGDELNPVAIVQRFFRSINDTVTSGRLNGTIVGIPTLNPNGNLHNSRYFYTSGSGGFVTDLNRQFPGKSVRDWGSLPAEYANAIWENVWGNGTGNVDFAVDLHTPSSGSTGPLWLYADYRAADVQRIAELVNADIVKIDPGEPGSIETTFVRAGVPAITLEVGTPRLWNHDLIQRVELFLGRLTDDWGLTSGFAKNYTPTVSYVATNFSSVTVEQSGWFEGLVQPLQDVEAGDIVGRLYNSWGDVLVELKSAVAGRIHTVRDDPAVEAGANVVSIAYNSTA